jgi:hypothetical protein
MNDCFVYSSIDKNCCFLKQLDGNKTFCYEFDPRSSSMTNYIQIEGVDYIAYCELPKYTPYIDNTLRCGEVNSTHTCSDYSKSDNTCCTYSYTGSDFKGCFYYGGKYIGEEKTINHQGLEINCKSQWLEFSYILILISIYL